MNRSPSPLRTALALLALCCASSTPELLAQEQADSTAAIRVPRTTASFTLLTGIPDLVSASLTQAVGERGVVEVGGGVLLPAFFARAGLRIPLTEAWPSRAGRGTNLLLMGGYRAVAVPMSVFRGPTLTVALQRWPLDGRGLTWQFAAGPWLPATTRVDERTGRTETDRVGVAGELRISFGFSLY